MFVDGRLSKSGHIIRYMHIYTDHISETSINGRVMQMLLVAIPSMANGTTSTPTLNLT